MKTIAFYLDNKNHKDIDFSNPKIGNPGIGGTQFLFWSIPYYIKEQSNEFNIIYLAPYINSLPKSIPSYLCKNEYESVQLAKNLGVDYLVLRGPNNSKKLFKHIKFIQQKVIFWSHNPEHNRFLSLLSKNEYVVKNISVSKSQRDKLFDHKAFKKCIYIYNAIDFNVYEVNKVKKPNINIAFMGSLTPNKGFIKLAEIWNEISQYYSHVNLYCIGSKDLYYSTNNSNENSGYVNKIYKILTDDSGILPENIKFTGTAIGNKKNDILNQIDIAVVNPLGTETFSLVAIEFEYYKIPVITYNKNGVLDTVKHNKTGLLFNNKREFITYLTELINNNSLRIKFGMQGHNYVRNKFSIDLIIKDWISLFNNPENYSNNEDVDYENFANNHKKTRLFNYRIKKYKLFSFLPSIVFYEDLSRKFTKAMKFIFRKK